MKIVALTISAVLLAATGAGYAADDNCCPVQNVSFADQEEGGSQGIVYDNDYRAGQTGFINDSKTPVLRESRNMAIRHDRSDFAPPRREDVVYESEYREETTGIVNENDYRAGTTGFIQPQK